MTDTTYKRRKSAGLCVGCGKCAPKKGRVRCEDCTRYEAEQKLRYRQEQISMGLCVVCGGREAIVGYLKCSVCTARDSQLRREAYARRRYRH